MLTGLTRPDTGSATIGGKVFRELSNPARTAGVMLDNYEPTMIASVIARYAAGAIAQRRCRASACLPLLNSSVIM
jgi:hypothetical protein